MTLKFALRRLFIAIEFILFFRRTISKNLHQESKRTTVKRWPDFYAMKLAHYSVNTYKAQHGWSPFASSSLLFKSPWQQRALHRSPFNAHCLDKVSHSFPIVRFHNHVVYGSREIKAWQLQPPVARLQHRFFIDCHKTVWNCTAAISMNIAVFWIRESTMSISRRCADQTVLRKVIFHGIVLHVEATAWITFGMNDLKTFSSSPS